VSVAVPIPELPEQIARFPHGPYMMTVAPDQSPRVTSIAVAWRDEVLVGGLGRRTGANVRANGAVALLWPAQASGDYALIVDGSASVEDAPDGSSIVVIRPHKAVLHVTRG
jgi:hypothetical protein